MFIYTGEKLPYKLHAVGVISGTAMDFQIPWEMPQPALLFHHNLPCEVCSDGEENQPNTDQFHR